VISGLFGGSSLARPKKTVSCLTFMYKISLSEKKTNNTVLVSLNTVGFQKIEYMQFFTDDFVEVKNRDDLACDVKNYPNFAFYTDFFG
jgi:hypothetical protein